MSWIFDDDPSDIIEFTINGHKGQCTHRVQWDLTKCTPEERKKWYAFTRIVKFYQIPDFSLMRYNTTLKLMSDIKTYRITDKRKTIIATSRAGGREADAIIYITKYATKNTDPDD